MKGVKKVISILVRIISIARMKLLMLPKAKKPDHFACKMSLLTCDFIKFSQNFAILNIKSNQICTPFNPFSKG
jgi:hypothetical protein